MVVCRSCKAHCLSYIYTDYRTPHCSSCYLKEKRKSASLVKKLPKVEEKEPPLGYHLFQSEYFSDVKKGKQFADFIWALNTGTLN